MSSLSHLTNSELLRVVGSKRVSPVIDELCKRLEQAVPERDLDDAQSNVTCPVCEAELTAGYLVVQEEFYVKDITT
jgi:hypothetical protein